jgi:hypothetical protein
MPSGPLSSRISRAMINRDLRRVSESSCRLDLSRDIIAALRRTRSLDAPQGRAILKCASDPGILELAACFGVHAQLAGTLDV